jgi:hypothetical protein
MRLTKLAPDTETDDKSRNVQIEPMELAECPPGQHEKYGPSHNQ